MARKVEVGRRDAIEKQRSNDRRAKRPSRRLGFLKVLYSNCNYGPHWAVLDLIWIENRFG